MKSRWHGLCTTVMVCLAGCAPGGKVDKAPADLDPGNPDHIQRLTRATESSFRKAIAAGNLAPFRDSVAAQWRDAMSAEEMAATYLPALAPLAVESRWLTAGFDIESPAQIDEDGYLHVGLRYPNPFYHLFVEHVYLKEAGEWKLGGYNINARRYDERWEALLQKVASLSQEGRVEEAIEAANEAIRIAVTLEPPDPGLVLTSIDNVCKLHLSRMDMESTVSMRLLSLTVLAKAVDPDNPRVAEELDQLFMAYTLLGRKEEAALCEAWTADVKAAAGGDAAAAQRLRAENRLQQLSDFKPSVPDTPDAIFSAFINRIEASMWVASARRGINLPDAYKELLSAIAAGNKDLAAKMYSDLQTNAGQIKNESLDPALANELIQHAREAFGAFEQFSTWEPALLDRYAREMIRSIPDGAVYFCGTDSGRFIIAAYRAALKLPFHMASQNMLADHGYMDYLRAVSPPELKLPSTEDLHAVFRAFSEAIKAGQIPAHLGEIHEDGRVTAKGMQGVMALNGQLSKMIFDRNKTDRVFIVDESYSIPWMVPYLEPSGLLMKLNVDKVHPLSAEVIQTDGLFWSGIADELGRNTAYAGCGPAQAAFSKLRCSIGGLYVASGLKDEAVGVLHEAFRLGPSSPEALYRLASVLAQCGKFDEAAALTDEFLKTHPDDQQIRNLRDRIQKAGSRKE